MSRNSMCSFPFKKELNERLFDPCIKNYTSSGDMDEKVDNWFDFFENFHQKYIIMPSISLNSLFLEEILFVTVRSSQGFINQNTTT